MLHFTAGMILALHLSKVLDHMLPLWNTVKSMAANWVSFEMKSLKYYSSAIILFSVTPVFEEINRTSGFLKLWTDLKRINSTHFKSRDLWTTFYLIKQEISIRSQSKSASLKMNFAMENLFRVPTINSSRVLSSFGSQQIGDKIYYGSGFSFRPDVLCDLKGKLRNWQKGSRLKAELFAVQYFSNIF